MKAQELFCLLRSGSGACISFSSKEDLLASKAQLVRVAFALLEQGDLLVFLELHLYLLICIHVVGLQRVLHDR